MMPEVFIPSFADAALPQPLSEQEHYDAKARAANHDFRTLLNIVLISAQMLRTYSPQISEAKRLAYLRRIEDAVTQMTALLGDLLGTGTR